MGGGRCGDERNASFEESSADCEEDHRRRCGDVATLVMRDLQVRSCHLYFHRNSLYYFSTINN